MIEQRRKRQSISSADKQCLVKAYDSKQNWKELAEQMEISKYSAQYIINRWKKSNVLQKGKLGGHKKQIISPVVGESLLKYTDSNLTATLKDMTTFLQSNHHLNVSKSTVHNFINKKSVTFNVDSGKNSLMTKQQRHDYVKYLCDNGYLPEECVYIGETTVPASGAVTLSLFMAISTQGVLHYKVTDGAFDFSKCQEFVDELSGIFLEDKLLFIMDNSWKNLQVSFENNIHSTQFIPPHSHFLYPLEGIFNELKADVESKIKKNLLKGKSSPSKEYAELVAGIKDYINTVDGNRIKDYYKHGIRYYMSCMTYTDICDVFI